MQLPVVHMTSGTFQLVLQGWTCSGDRRLKSNVFFVSPLMNDSWKSDSGSDSRIYIKTIQFFKTVMIITIYEYVTRRRTNITSFILDIE